MLFIGQKIRRMINLAITVCFYNFILEEYHHDS